MTPLIEAVPAKQMIHVDLEMDGASVIGYKAKRTSGLIDLRNSAGYDTEEFWEPIHAQSVKHGLILEPNAFYILASKERVSIEPREAAELVAYDPSLGELRCHYAGFLDPGFGSRAAGGKPSRIVLEIRGHDVPFLIENDQVVATLNYDVLAEDPKRLYGESVGSHYQNQELRLAKVFR